MREAEEVQALRGVGAALSVEWTPALAAVGVRFDLGVARRLSIRGLEEGLDLYAWPEADLDNYFEAWRTRSWSGRWRMVTILSDLAASL